MLGKKVRHKSTGVVGIVASSVTVKDGTNYRVDHSDENGDHETWAPASELEVIEENMTAPVGGNPPKDAE